MNQLLYIVVGFEHFELNSVQSATRCSSSLPFNLHRGRTRAIFPSASIGFCGASIQIISARLKKVYLNF
jgi:hypothetical protein